jgi:uncharacterized protein (TIGR04141 family)
MPKSRTLNIRLLRQGRSIEDTFSESFKTGEPRALQQRAWNDIENARLYIGQIYTNPPSWRSFLETGATDLPTDIFTGGAGAVLFLPVGARTMAVCFGHVHLALNDDCFERQFGLKVALNSVPRDRLRTLDLATPDAVTFQKRIQASRDSDLQGFGVDILRDLARVAGGTPSKSSFARFVAGKDTLSITCEVDAATLSAKCQEVLEAYNGSDYKTHYAWIDNMRTVSEKDEIEKLDAVLFAELAKLRAGKPSDLHLAPPEIVNYTEGSQLHYNGFGSHGTDFFSLSIDDYVSELNRCSFAGDIIEIKEKHRVKAKNSTDDEFTEKWRVYDCFVMEASLGDGANQQFYALFAGIWYRVEKAFKHQVEAFFDSIPKISVIGATNCRNEQELIDHLAASRADLVKLDRVNINPLNVKYANLEPCDFFSEHRQFIHLKDGHSSGPISHLWFQGVVSAEAFVSDRDFRKKLRSKVRSLSKRFASLLPKSNQALTRTDFQVVFGIMRKPYADGTLGLPFFSKVSLQGAVERIQLFGIAVAIELIAKPSSDAYEITAETA